MDRGDLEASRVGSTAATVSGCLKSSVRGESMTMGEAREGGGVGMAPRERVIVAIFPPSHGFFLLLPEGAEGPAPAVDYLPTTTVFMSGWPLPR